MTTYKFPDGFIWGAATSAYQIEGSPHADGAGMSIQHRWAHTPGNTPGGANGDVVADHYHRYREDIAIMRDLGLQTYQFSTAWPRILPEGTGPVNKAGLDFYDMLVDLMLEAGIAPAPILHVWDLPGALQDRGGWANRDCADWFAEYAAIVFDKIGDRAKMWFTICEPVAIAFGGYGSGWLPPGVKDVYAAARAAHTLMLAHGRAVQAFRASGAKGMIGTSTVASVNKPASDRPDDVAAAERGTLSDVAMYLDPIYLGSYPKQILDSESSETRSAGWFGMGHAPSFGELWPEIREGDMAVISEPIDFLGFTYFQQSTVSAEDEEGRGDGQLATDIGWTIRPEGLLDTLRWLRDRYDNPPMIVSENGAAYSDVVQPDGTIADSRRIDYIRDHLIAGHKAIAEGINLRGWFVWSLMDTYEFFLGLDAKFGLVHVDYETQKRIVKNSGYWYRDVMAANGFEA